MLPSNVGRDLERILSTRVNLTPDHESRKSNEKESRSLLSPEQGSVGHGFCLILQTELPS